MSLLKELSRASRDSFELESDSKKKIISAIVGRIKPIVLGFFRIGFRFERILRRSPEFLQKWCFEIFAFFEYWIDRIDRTYRTQSVSIISIEGRLVRWSVDDDGLWYKKRRRIIVIKAVFDRYDRYGIFDMFDRFDIAKTKNFETPLLKELSQSSQDCFESESDSKESQDDRLDSPKSGKNEKCHFWRN